MHPSSSSHHHSAAALEVTQRKRHERLAQEKARKERFVQGDDLYALRSTVMALRDEYQKAPRGSVRRQEVLAAMLRAQQVDAEFVYENSLLQQQWAEWEGDARKAEQYAVEARNARLALPQFQLEGLWVGKYGNHGFEMINVTYVGDTLVATKVTGDKNVPKGEVSFTVDLSPSATPLEPLELQQEAAQPWGCRFLPRFTGQGQVAGENHQLKQWLTGQLILVKNYFSFAWLPLGQQVFFGRPSPELTLKLLKRSQAVKEEDATRSFLNKCWEETEVIEEDLEVHGEHPRDYYTQEGCFE
jgi:hypothetical protein